VWFGYSGRYIDRAVCLSWVMPYWEMPLPHTEGLNVLEQPWSRSLYEWNLIWEPSFAYGMAVLAKNITPVWGQEKIIVERTIRAVKSRKFCLRFEECVYRLVKKTLRSWTSQSFWGEPGRLTDGCWSVSAMWHFFWNAWFQVSAAKCLRTALFWVITQRVVVIS
jgi:hypothetical protein